MHVDEQVDAGGVQRRQRVENFWRTLGGGRGVVGRRRPLAVQVGPARVDAQVAAHRPVWVHVWHYVEGEEAEGPLHESVGHAGSPQAE